MAKRLIFLVSIATVLIGCSSWSNKKLTTRLDQLYDEYVSGDIDHARKSMETAVELLIHTDDIPEHGRAVGLYMAYGRLYSIELVANNTQAASANFEQARKWYVRCGEIAQTPIETQQEKLSQFTPDYVHEFVTKWDKNNTQGRGAVYSREKNAVL